jgi:hypothetical protein
MTITKRKTNSKGEIKVFEDNLCSLLEIEKFEDLHERNCDWIFDSSHKALSYHIKEFRKNNPNVSDDDVDAESEKYREDYEIQLGEKMRKHYLNALEKAAEYLFANHGMEISRKKAKTGASYFIVKPKESWKDVCEKLVETINGVGYFYFDNAAALADSIPDTYKGTAISHFHWMNDYSRVYGCQSANSSYESEMEWAFRYAF